MDDITTTTHIATASFDHLELFYQGKAIKIAKQNLPFTLGRDTDLCELVINHPKVSRQHCKIVVDDERVGLMDNSSNGTALQIGREPSIMVKDSFYPLLGRGYIQLGKAIDADDSELICFKMVFKAPE